MVGVFAFATSGALPAVRKRFDIVGIAAALLHSVHYRPGAGVTLRLLALRYHWRAPPPAAKPPTRQPNSTNDSAGRATCARGRQVVPGRHRGCSLS
ncbi:hypothetical protein ACFVMC_29710 [Nocardia sp. NPDC127579]|uniref:hypothetical protein n=1 Tax=Nocardia sp. NPDC127579 TaxID=3345402 RepID=UPI003643655D